MSLADFRRSFYQLAYFPIGKVCYGVRERFIIWEGEVQPFPYTGKYTLCLNYERLWPPRVWIVEPDFSKLKGLPHVYPGNRLCLYHPSDWAWKGSYNIIDTIIRWSQMWIVYFEDYLRTGAWRGPAADHERPKDNDIENAEEPTNKKKKASIEGEPIYLKNYPIRLSRKRTKKVRKGRRRGT